jgi:hypothetical protein
MGAVSSSNECIPYMKKALSQPISIKKHIDNLLDEQIQSVIADCFGSFEIQEQYPANDCYTIFTNNVKTTISTALNEYETTEKCDSSSVFGIYHIIKNRKCNCCCTMVINSEPTSVTRLPSVHSG